jgi:hypothetical protein
LGRSAVGQRRGAVHLRGGEGDDGIDERLQPVELITHLHGIDFRVGLGEVGVEGHLILEFGFWILDFGSS